MRRFNIAVATTLALAAVASGPVFAEAKLVSDATTVIDNADVNTVARLVAEIGGQSVETKEENNDKFVIFHNGQQPYVVSISACESGKCVAVVPMALLDTSPTTITLDQLNKINGDNVFLSGFKLEGNTIGFAHVLIIDGGVTRQNLALNIAGFVQTYEETLKKLASPVTSSLVPSQQQPAAAMASTRFHPVMPDPRHLRAISDQLLAQHRAMLTSGIRH